MFIKNLPLINPTTDLGHPHEIYHIYLGSHPLHMYPYYACVTRSMVICNGNENKNEKFLKV